MAFAPFLMLHHFWNHLPNNVYSAPTAPTCKKLFKRSLKMYLFNQAFLK